MKNKTKPLLISMVLISVLIVGIGVVAGNDDLLGEYETGDKEFKRVEIGDMIVYWYQRMIDGAIVEGDYIVYQFDKDTKDLIEKKTHWRSDLSEDVTPVITKKPAEYKVTGEVQFTQLYIISQESVVFPLDPTPQNPCWVVRSVDNGNMIVTIIDAVEGKTLGYGIPPPYTGFSLGGPNWGSCDPYYTSWAQNAETWFETMGYDTEMVDCPTDAKVQSHIQSTETAMFYELAHGGSYSFHNICPDSESITATEVETWITGFTKMPFTFLGSCGGLCVLTDNTLSYEFRKGSMDDTVTVGYCHMEYGPDDPYDCTGAWANSINWQTALFDYMEDGDTVKDAFDQALADYPMCVNCMRFAGDENFAVVPVVTRGALPVADAGPDQNLEQAYYQGANAALNGSGSYDPDGDPLTYRWTWNGESATGVNPTVSLPLGTTTISLTVNDGEDSAPDTVDITVVDTTPPDISVTVSPDTLWPPNHKMVDITATVTVNDICDAAPTVVLTTVTSDEPDDAIGNGDGRTVNDIQAEIGTEDYEFQLRAERAGTGDGRVYTITYTVTDASGNSASASATVVVPLDMDLAKLKRIGLKE